MGVGTDKDGVSFVRRNSMYVLKMVVTEPRSDNAGGRSPSTVVVGAVKPLGLPIESPLLVGIGLPYTVISLLKDGTNALPLGCPRLAALTLPSATPLTFPSRLRVVPRRRSLNG